MYNLAKAFPILQEEARIRTIQNEEPAQTPPAPVHPNTVQDPNTRVTQYFGIPNHVADSQEFCNMILFIAFAVIVVFFFDSFTKIILKLRS